MWRRVVLVGSFGAVIAFIVGAVLEPGSSGMPDRLVYAAAASVLLLLTGVLLVLPGSLKGAATLMISVAGGFFVYRLCYLLFGAPPGTDVPKEMTENLFWIPVVYIVGYLIPGLTLGRRLALLINLLMLLVSGCYFLAAPKPLDPPLLSALAQLDLANWSFAYAVRSFSVYLDVALRAHARGEAMAKLAHTDALTGLANRLQFEQDLRHTLVTAAGAGYRSAVVFIDLDYFKHINDTLGHAAGDELLVRVAERLRRSTREGDVLARLGGDEFVLLLPRLRKSQAAETVINHLERVFAAPFELTSQAVHITASVGKDAVTDAGETSELLLARSDAAMYRVKERGRAGSQRYAA